MRLPYWILAGVAVLVLLWVPPRVVERRAGAALRSVLQPSGGLAVRARVTPLGLLRGRIDLLDLEAAGVRLGDLVAGRLAAELRGVALWRAGGGWAIRVRDGIASVEIGQADLERYLRERGVEQPSVRIDASGIEATGRVQMDPVSATARVLGQLYGAGGTDLYFRVASLDLGGTEVPPGMVNAVFAMGGRPVATLRGLPVPVLIEQVAAEPGRVIARVRIGEAVP